MLHYVQQVISDFLQRKDAEVLLITGHWGTGKTYSWNLLVKEASQSERLSRQQYSYVSLFGISDLQQLKDAIFEGTIDPKDQNGTGLQTLRENISSLLDSPTAEIENLTWRAKIFGMRKSRQLLNLPYLATWGSFARDAAYLSIRNRLICFDDFERKGQWLSAAEVLGLVSVLKEQRNCKIALILNHDELDNGSRRAFEKYREKVIDIEIEFAPSSADACQLVVSNTTPLDQRLIGWIEKLGINNVRIISKLNRHWQEVLPFFTDLSEGVPDRVAQSLVLLAWCFYSKEDNVPKLDYLKKHTTALYEIDEELYATGEDDKTPIQEKEWNYLLSNYGFAFTDQLDLVLISYLERGYIDIEHLKVELKHFNDRLLEGDGQDTYRKVWNLFHNTFADNEEQFLQSLEHAFRQNIRYLSPAELDSALRVLRELGRDNTANTLLDEYVEVHSSQPKTFDLTDYAFAQELHDEALKSKFQEKWEELAEAPSLRQVVESIAEKKGWGGQDEKILLKASVDDFYDLFKQIEDEHLTSCVRACLQLGANSETQSIGENAKAALDRLGAESNINRLRMRKFNVRFPPRINKPPMTKH